MVMPGPSLCFGLVESTKCKVRIWEPAGCVSPNKPQPRTWGTFWPQTDSFPCCCNTTRYINRRAPGKPNWCVAQREAAPCLVVIGSVMYSHSLYMGRSTVPDRPILLKVQFPLFWRRVRRLPHSGLRKDFGPKCAKSRLRYP
jgi:hypothetical protein